MGGKALGVAMSEMELDSVDVTDLTVTGTVSFFGQTAAEQQATIAAVATTAATSTTNAYGYSTAAQADAIVTGLNSVIAALIALGFVASS